MGLLNIGVEPSKGLPLQLEAHKLLTQAHEAGRINFVGNVEGREAILSGPADVLVTDGFTGNIFMKTCEGSLLMVSDFMKEMFKTSLKTKLGYLAVKKQVDDFKKTFNPNEVGGTAMVGISKPVIKAHGSSNGYAIYNAIRQARDTAQSGLIADIEANIDHMRLSAPEEP